jgi:hypothetical protein
MTEPEATNKTHTAADECAVNADLLFRVASILHDNRTDHTPMMAYGLTKGTHMKAAAKVLRQLALILVGREKQLREKVK